MKKLAFLAIISLSFGLWMGCSEVAEEVGPPEPATEEEEEGSGLDEEAE